MLKWTSLLIAITACGFPRPADVIACSPGEFAECRGDTALSCNSAGGNYDAVQCARGCDPVIGCRLCDASQTVCTDGKVQSCDAAGAITSSEGCPLGCFEDQPRCREIDPSNNLAAYEDMASSAPDLDLTNAFFASDTGIVTAGNRPIVVPSFLVERSGNGVQIRIFVAKSAKLTKAMFGAGSMNSPGIAMIARNDIDLEGEMVVSPLAGGAVLGCHPAGTGTWGPAVSSGGGGGANAGDGATGGAVLNMYPGGEKDIGSGTTALVPLRGGCSGGNPVAPYQNGGGAVQFSSGTAIHVNSTIDARGQDGTYNFSADNASVSAGGGGGGGSILLEAPQVVLGANSKLLTSGGNGYTTCPSPSCGAAGTGGTAMTPATKGADVQNVPGASGGGGGGGLGRVRINTKTGVYTKTNSTVEDAVLTTGILSTR